MRILLAGLVLVISSSVNASAETSDNPAAAPPQEQGVPARLPVSAYAELPFVEGARLSPDGMVIAGQFAVRGQQRLVVMSPFDHANMSQATLPEDVEIGGMQWVGNENLVIKLKTIRPFDAGDRAYVTRLVGYNIKTQKFTKMLWDLGGQHVSDIIWVPSDGSTKILVAGQNSIYLGDDFWPSVYRVDVTNGRRVTDTDHRSGVMDWIADSNGVVRAAISTDDDGKRRALLYREPGNSSFQRSQRVAYANLEVPVLIRPEQNRTLVLRTGNDGRHILAETDGTTGEITQTLYAAPAGVEIDGVRYDDVGNDVIGVYLGGGATEPLHWLDPQLAELQSAFEKSLNGRRARIITLSSDRKRMLVRVDKPNEAGRLYYFDQEDGSLRLFAKLNNSLSNSSRTAAVETIRYKARDGLEIEAIMTTPPGRVAKDLPTVILPHGGPWAQDTMDWDYWAQFIASRGYLVIQPNFRGSTGYGEKFLKRGEGQLGYAMQDDVNDALGWASKQGLADPKRACVVGASYGGYVAMWGAARDPDLWRCSISIAGVANLRREVNDFGDLLYGKRYREEWQKMTPDFPAVSPMNHIDAIKVPMLLIHGKKDLTVDYSQSQAMFNKMKAAGKSVELVSLPLANHYFSREADRVTLLQSIEAFLAKHNPAD